jgi:hypothetical protein
MKAIFVHTANVVLFKNAIGAMEGRYAPERGICVIHGEAGFGKSRTALWWSVQNRAAMISVFPLAAPGWVLRDLVRELGGAPKRSVEDVKLQAVGLLAADPRAIVVDEVENALHHGAGALDALRAVADICEVPLVLVGREGTLDKLHHHKQIWRRIGGKAELKPVSLADVHLLARELAEAEIGDDVIEAVHAHCGGLICAALTGIAIAEKAARKAGRAATLADIDATELMHPWDRARANVTGLAAARRRRGA